jgi:type II secretory ATPase GspE/PulE/Tfp pilus assembly ATPase PilB-like protein
MTAVGELLTITPALRRALESGGGLDEIRAAATGPRTMRDELADRVLAGEVSAAEAVRALGS